MCRILAPLAWTALLAAVLCGCRGKGGICGNAKTERSSGEECDCGTDPLALPSTCIDVNGGLRSNCTADCKAQNVNYTTLNIHWIINGLWEEGGSFDHCNDVGAQDVRLVTYGPGGFTDEQVVGCGQFVLTYIESQQMILAPGTYTVSATLLRYGDALGEPQMGQGLVQTGWTTDLTVNFPMESLYGYEDFTGDLLLRLTYDGADCPDASPMFQAEQMTLSVDSSPLSGYPVQRACDTTFWIINGLPAGDLLMRIEGIADATNVLFCEEFPIKIGVGNNRPYFRDVPQTADGSCFPP